MPSDFDPDYDAVIAGPPKPEQVRAAKDAERDSFDYGAAIDEESQLERSQLQHSLYAASMTEPGRQAEVINTARKLNVSSDTVNGALDEAKQQANRFDPDYDSIISDTPGLKKYLLKPENAALSRDDMDTLAQMDKTGKRLTRDESIVDEYSTAVGSGFLNLGSSVLHVAKALGMIDKEQAKTAQAFIKERQKLLNETFRPEYMKDIDKVIETQGPSVTKTAVSMIESAADAFWAMRGKGRMKDSPITALKNYLRDDAVSIGEALDMLGEFAKRPRGTGYLIAEQAANSLPAIAGGVPGAAARIGGAGLLASGALSFGGTFLGGIFGEVGSQIEELLTKNGVDTSDPESLEKAYSNPELMSQINLAATKKGVTTTLADSLLSGLSPLLVKGSGVKSFAKRTALEGLQEGAGEGLGQLAREGDVRKVDFGEVLVEIVAGFGQALGQAGVSQAAAGAKSAVNTVKSDGGEAAASNAPPDPPPPGAPPSAQAQDKEVDPLKTSREEYSAEPFEALVEIRKDVDLGLKAISDAQLLSELGERAKELKHTNLVEGKIAEFVSEITGGKTSVFFDFEKWNEFWRSKGMSPSEVASQMMTDGGRAYVQAQDSGQPIQINIGTFVEKSYQTEFFTPLIEIARTGSADAMTFEEAEPFLKEDLKPLMQQVAQEAENSQEPIPQGQLSPEADAASREIEQQIIQAGRPPEEAKIIATLEGAGLEALKQNYGANIGALPPTKIASGVTAEPRTVTPEEVTGLTEYGPESVEQENARLKDVVAEQAETIRIQDAQLHRSETVPELGNKRAFKKDLKNSSLGFRHVGEIDMDGLKVFNTLLGYHAGTHAIQRIGKHLAEYQAVSQDTVRFYHTSGDEFFALFKNPEDAGPVLAHLKESLLGAVFQEESSTGVPHVVSGIRIGVGHGTDEKLANKALEADKLARAKTGERTDRLTEERNGGDRRAQVDRRLPDYIQRAAGPAQQDENVDSANRPDAFQSEPGQGDEVKKFDQSALSAPRLSPIGLYSQVEREVEKMNFKEMPAGQLWNTIKNIQGIKKEELTELGLEEYLNAKEGKVSKAEVLQYIQDNGPRVELVVKAASYKGSDTSGISDLDWSEPKQIDSDPYGERQADEYSHFMVAQPEDYFEDEYEAFKAEHPEEWAKAESGGYSEKRKFNGFWEENAPQEVKDRAEKMAEDSVNDPEGPYAEFRVTDRYTGWTLVGSDERGWYNDDTDETFEIDLEEAKVQLALKMIEKGEIGGSRKDLIQEKDIKWKARIDGQMPSRATIQKKLKALAKADPEKYVAAAKALGYGEGYDTEKENAEDLQRGILIAAEEEVENSYKDPDNKKNKVSVKIDHPALDAKITGNNVKGWTLRATDVEANGKEFANFTLDLEAKNIEEAKAEAVKKLVEAGIASPSNPVPALPGPVDPYAPTEKTQFDRYKVKGGEDYQELLITVPNVEPKFTEGHWREPNVIAHLRVTTRVGPNGEKVLAVEENQSDAHQKGRERGYLSETPSEKELPEGWYAQQNTEEEDPSRRWAVYDDGDEMAGDWADTEQEAIANALERRGRELIPDLPFKQTDAWAALTMKTVLRMAIEKGYDAVAWFPGSVHTERWGTDSISWVKNTKPSWIVSDGRGDYFGPYNSKEMADKRHSSLNAHEKEEYSVVERRAGGFLVGSVEQVGGNAEGFDIEERARQRGNLLERRGVVVTSEAELKKVVADTLNRERSDRSLESLTSTLWKQMQTQESGLKAPRKEGFEFFYDNLLPKKVVPGILKKMDKDAKVEVKPLESRGQNNEGETPAWFVKITDKMRESAKQGFTLFQEGREGDKPPPRAQIFIGKNGVDVTLLKDADFSSLVHELVGHRNLETLAALATQGNARAQADVQTLLNWWGLKSWDEVKTEHHEMWARGVEKYLMEGVAPKPELVPLFERAKRLLFDIYKKLSALNVELTPEVRDVMARLMAPEKEIPKVEQEYGPPNPFGMVGAKAEAFAKVVAEAGEAAKATLAKSLIDDFEKKKEAEYQDRRNIVQAEVEEEISALPVYKAIEALSKEDVPASDDGPALPALRLSRKDITLGFGAKYLESMPEGIVSDDGVNPSLVFESLGFKSAKEMLEALNQAPPKEDIVDQVTEQRMAERYPDLMQAGLSDEAIKAFHNEKRTQILRMQLEHLAEVAMPEMKAGIRAIARRVPRDADVKAQAKQIIGEKATLDIKPHIYSRAAVKYAREAGVLFTQGDFAGAFEAKRKELLNHELFRAATEALETVEKAEKLFKKVMGKDDKLAKSRNMDYVNAARAIVAGYGYGQSEKSANDYIAPIAQYDPEMFKTVQQIVESLPAPGTIEASSFAGFDRMHEIVKALWSLSRQDHQMLIEGKRVEKQVAKDALATQTEHSIKDPGRFKKWVKKHGEKAMFALGWRSALRRVESWVDTMDLGDPNGAFRRYIWAPISEAATQYRLAKSGVMKQYLELVKAIEPTLTFDPIDAPELNGFQFKNKGQLLGALLHSGNESNLSKLLRGYGWGSQNEDGTLNRLAWDKFVARATREGLITKADMDCVQSVWDLMEAQKPALQEAHKEMYGFYFPEVEAAPIETPFGKYKGGYFPARVDTLEVEAGAANFDEEMSRQNQNSYAFPTTGKGATLKRVENYAAPLALDLQLVPSHLDWAMRFIHLEPRVKEVGRLLFDKEVRGRLKDIDPTIMSDMLIPWLQRVATQRLVSPLPAWSGKGLTRFLQHFRKNTGLQIMAANAINTVQQFTGISISATKVKPRYLRNALAEYSRSPKKMAEEIAERSDFMNTRMDNSMSDAMQDLDKILLNPNTFQKAQAWAMAHSHFFQKATQNVVDTVTWMGAYEQAKEDGQSEAEAVKIADSTVRLTQGSGAVEDVSRFETGNALARMFTMFAGYFNMQANLLGSEFTKIARTSGLKNGAGKALFVYTMGFLIPAVLSEAIRRAGVGKLDEDDDDEYLDDLMAIFFGSQLRGATAMLPIVGPTAMTLFNTWNEKPYDDRLTSSPAISTLESAIKAPSELYKSIVHGEGKTSRTIKDTLTLLGLMSGLPIGPVAKPVGYLSDVAEGEVEPGGPIDFARGLITGRGGN